jgi:hypothetical protein
MDARHKTCQDKKNDSAAMGKKIINQRHNEGGRQWETLSGIDNA